jgi:SAM-dependent methyltransferase
MRFDFPAMLEHRASSSSPGRRTLRPEILDSLAPDDPAAQRSRRDLRRINWAMGNPCWMVRTLRARLGAGERVLEIGAGTGDLGRRLIGQGMAVDGLDRWPRPVDWPADRAWHQADLREFDGYRAYPVVIANLILHHLADAELAALGRALAAGPRLVCASEPARRRRNQVGFALLCRLLGADPVTRHDGHVSIAAGFAGDELPRALGLTPPTWTAHLHENWRGASRAILARPG